MNDKTARVITALMIDVFYFASIPIAIFLPTFIGYYQADLGYMDGIWFGIDWFKVASSLFIIYSNAIMGLPFYALIQAAPEGAFKRWLKWD
ncbi:hypothetical protein M0R72_15335 [Candidatus Pacearchaeota archaeon]|jgi:hypothetical protein|nr:hypothetical protein [Candidatus Pacearchaeota archaeon]